MTDDRTGGSEEPAPKEAAEGSGQPAPAAPGKKPRTAKQLAALEAGRAKRAANQKASKARKVGVDTTGGAGADVSDLPPGAPKVQTTAHRSAPESPEQRKRREDGKPEPDTSDVDPPAPEERPAPPARTGSRSGLLGMLADGLGL